MLTIQILIKNNEKTIEKCLKSIASLKAKIIIGDIGSTDSTSYICKKYGLNPKPLSINNNLSKVRNELLAESKTEWQMYIHPFEFLSKGQDEIYEIINNVKEKKSYNFKVIQGTTITSEIRLWNKKLNFKNPVFETIEDVEAGNLNVALFAKHTEKDLNLSLKIIENWKKEQPISVDPYYYQALIYLTQSKYEEFLEVSRYYLFKNKNSISSTMLRYYLSMVQCYVKSDLNEAAKNILTCIANNELMAEFWCLLGDIFYKNKKYSEAVAFYENAILLGSRRKQPSDWPLDVSKYKEYPQKMINNSKNLLLNTKIYQQSDPVNPVH